jgi:hypothetical protein
MCTDLEDILSQDIAFSQIPLPKLKTFPVPHSVSYGVAALEERLVARDGGHAQDR